MEIRQAKKEDLEIILKFLGNTYKFLKMKNKGEYFYFEKELK